MLLRFLVFFSFLLISSEGFAQAPKLVIFTLHGFIGDEGTFCDLKSILEEDYGAEVAVHNLRYSSLDAKTRLQQEGTIDNRDVKYFTIEVYKDMSRFYRSNNIDINTPFALVAHSQGGIIGMRYVAECIHGNEYYCSGKLNGKSITPKNLKYFITLATPFWGSTAANHLKVLDFIQSLLPIQQVKDLSMGSSIITYNRELSLKPLIDKNENIFPADTEVVTVSGDISRSALGTLFKLATDKESNGLLEHDLVVPTFSANMDYHYKIYPAGELATPISGKTTMADYYYPIHGFHAEYGFIEGLACVKKIRDEDRRYTDNTIYLILRKHLDKFLTSSHKVAIEKLNEASRFVTDLQTFNMEVKLNLPQKDAWFRKIHFQKKHIQAFSDDPLVVDVERRNSLLFHKFRGFNYDHSASDLNYVTYYHTAFFERGYFSQGINTDFSLHNVLSQDADFNLSIRIPWFKPIDIKVPVSPAYTSFVEYSLEPIDRRILPFEINSTSNREMADGNQLLSVQSKKNKVKVFTFNLSSSRGTVQTEVIPKKDWLTNLQLKNVEGVEELLDECYTSTVASKEYYKNNYYLGFYDEEPQAMQTERLNYHVNLQHFRIIGRYAEGKYDPIDQTYERDRVLVTSNSLKKIDRDISVTNFKPDQYLRSGYYWVNTKAVRLIEGCSKVSSLPE